MLLLRGVSGIEREQQRLACGPRVVRRHKKIRQLVRNPAAIDRVAELQSGTAEVPRGTPSVALGPPYPRTLLQPNPGRLAVLRLHRRADRCRQPEFRLVRYHRLAD